MRNYSQNDSTSSSYKSCLKVFIPLETSVNVGIIWRVSSPWQDIDGIEYQVDGGEEECWPEVKDKFWFWTDDSVKDHQDSLEWKQII